MKAIPQFFGMVLALAGCHEIPQDARKPYASTEDVQPWTGDVFKGDKAKFEEALTGRTNTQDEYLRTGGANK